MGAAGTPVSEPPHMLELEQATWCQTVVTARCAEPLAFRFSHSAVARRMDEPQRSGSVTGNSHPASTREDVSRNDRGTMITNIVCVKPAHRMLR
jgi:hypothetical protein